MSKITSRNLEFLRAIQQIQDQSGWTPTVRELGQQLGISSSSTVHSHLVALRNGGLLENRGSRWRITDRGRDVLGVIAA